MGPHLPPEPEPRLAGFDLLPHLPDRGGAAARPAVVAEVAAVLGVGRRREAAGGGDVQKDLEQLLGLPALARILGPVRAVAAPPPGGEPVPRPGHPGRLVQPLPPEEGLGRPAVKDVLELAPPVQVDPLALVPAGRTRLVIPDPV